MSNDVLIHSLITVLIISLVTILLRAIPFIIFGRSKETPKFIKYLSTVLPLSIMGMLVIYCIKDISFSDYKNFVPTIIGVVCVVIIQSTTKKTLLSIVCGTVLYMLLINLL